MIAVYKWRQWDCWEGEEKFYILYTYFAYNLLISDSPSSLCHPNHIWLWAYPGPWISPLPGRLFGKAHQSPGPSTTAVDSLSLSPSVFSAWFQPFERSDLPSPAVHFASLAFAPLTFCFHFSFTRAFHIRLTTRQFASGDSPHMWARTCFI
jgi:hypothetical protein